MFRRTPRRSQGSDQTAQPVEGVCLPDSGSDIELLDMDLFTNDFDLWFAKATVQFYLAIAIQREHLGHAAVNPKAILKHVEARYWSEPSQNAGSSIGLHNPGSELFSRIKAARATKNDKALEVFLEHIFSDIQSSCRELRTEQAAELDASSMSEYMNRATTPSSTTSSNPDSEDTGEETNSPAQAEKRLSDDDVPSSGLSVQGGLQLQQPPNTTSTGIRVERPLPDDAVLSLGRSIQGGLILAQPPNTTDAAINIERSLPDNLVSSPSPSVQSGLPSPQPLRTEQPLYEYTSMLFEYASVSGTPPEYIKDRVSADKWRCEAVFNGTRGVGEARTWKNARHIASQKICEALGITKE